MQRELFRLINTIKEKTGINIAIISNDGVIDVSTFKEYFPLCVELFSCDEDIIKDKDNSKTYFKFNYSGHKCLGVIDGDDETSKNYATFIKEQIENSKIGSVKLSYDDEFATIVTGESSKSRIMHFISKYSIPKQPCLCLLIKCATPKSKEICDFIDEYSLNSIDNAVVLDNYTCAYVCFVADRLEGEFKSEKEYAEYFIRSLYEELGINARVFLGGEVENFANISTSYNQAVSAERISGIFGLNSSVTAYRDFVLVKMAEDMPKNKIQEYLNVLLNQSVEEVFEDEELFYTAEGFINNDLNVSLAARNLHVHRNTLIYRLEKIEKLTGLDIKKFNDALDFRIISVLKRLLG